MTASIEKREIGNLVVEGIPEIPKEINHTLQQYQNTREASFVGWLHNSEKMLIATRFGESTQFHLVKSPGGQRSQVTFFSEPLFNGKICPSKTENSFTFLKDKGGNELYQIYYYNLDTQKYKRLTDGKSRNGASLWNHKGDAVVYTSTKRNGIDHDIYVCYPHSSQNDQLIHEGKGLWYTVGWSADDEYITLNNYLSINESYLYKLHIQSGTLEPILPSGSEISCLGGIWAKDGSGVYYTSDFKHQFRQLVFHAFESGTTKVISKNIPWDVESLIISPDGKSLIFATNENGISKLYLLDTTTHQYQSLDALPAALYSNLKWHPNSQKIGLTINKSNAPADVFAYDIPTKTLTQWTFSEVGGLLPEQFISPQLISYPTFDEDKGQKRNIPAFYYLPKKEVTPQKFPVLIYIHGGPESQFRPGFSPLFQYYLNELKVAVIAPNVRGSTGHGKHFIKLDNGYKREDSVKDIGKLIEWIEQQPELDSSKIAVMGGSYGGYMVLASMAHFNDKLKCGIDIVGISNFVTFLKNTKPYRRDLRRVEYGDERDPKMRKHLEKISPTTNAHKITKPMFIIQGLNDPRVPASEAEQMLKAIRQNGGEAWYLLAKDEGHGFRKKINRDFYTKAVIVFLRKYLFSENRLFLTQEKGVVSSETSN